MARIWFAVVALLFAACAGGGGEQPGHGSPEAEATQAPSVDEPSGQATPDTASATTSSAAVTTGTSFAPRELVYCNPPANNSTPAGRAVPQIASTDSEDVPSALEDPLHPGLPEPAVDLERIIAANPRVDGIPPVDDPRFVDASAVAYIADCELLISVALNGDARAYPVQILIWHEIVNDTVGGIPVAITYCPLCNSAVAFDRRLGDRILDFGTSGGLYNSALVMYDRQTESLWTHFTGDAIAGLLTGESLASFPVETVTWADWRSANPNGLVLSRETGVERLYGTNPYEAYDRVNLPSHFFDGEAPDPYKDKERFIGFLWQGEPYAVRLELAYASGVTEVDVGGSKVSVWVQPGAPSPLDRTLTSAGVDVGTTGVFVPQAAGRDLNFRFDGDAFVDDQTGSTWSILGRAVAGDLEGAQLQRVEHLDTFWFAWTAFHPTTMVIDQ